MADDTSAGALDPHQLRQLDPELNPQSGLAPTNKIDAAAVFRVLQRVIAERDLLLHLVRQAGISEAEVERRLQLLAPSAEPDSQVEGKAGRKPPQSSNGEQQP